jgi:hypothetical protein
MKMCYLYYVIYKIIWYGVSHNNNANWIILYDVGDMAYNLESVSTSFFLDIGLWHWYVELYRYTKYIDLFTQHVIIW